MRTFEYRVRPNRKQETALWAVLKASRVLYNQLLQELIEHHEQTGKYLHIYEQDKRHGAAQHPDLPAVVVDTTLKRVHRSFANFFRGRAEGRKVGFPRFKSARRWDTFAYRDRTNALQGRYFQAGKHCGGKIRCVVHRPLEGTFKFARIVHRPSGWYLQCVCETEAKPLPKLDNAVGLDVGITYLVADSDGHTIKNPKHLRTSHTKLARHQRKAARCKKGSNNRRKVNRNIARMHERIRSQRMDTLHKVSRRYINAYQTIVIEDLNIAGLVRNHSLSGAIVDASWGTLRLLLTAKAEEAGRQVIAVSPHYTSQKCSQCGAYAQKALSVRTHICPTCGYMADRDHNAARNILMVGLSARTEPPSRVGEDASNGGVTRPVETGSPRLKSGECHGLYDRLLRTWEEAYDQEQDGEGRP